MKVVGIGDLRADLSHYLNLVEEKNEIIKITNYNVLIAEIRPIKNKNKKIVKIKK